uniref:Transmembrane 4 L six family member 5 n=1 Tax=Sarcophilus harrisii TaxID=9305 RepID=G3VEW6_SARHA
MEFWSNEGAMNYYIPLVMCTGICAQCIGFSLILLSIICIVANTLLLVPNGETKWTKHLSMHVILSGGFIGGGLMVLCPGIAAVQAGGRGICGAGCCKNRCRMLCSVCCSAFGVSGALYCLLVSISALQNGPLCLTKSNKWSYPFRNTNGRYLDNKKLWEECVKPPNIVQWNLDLFALLTAMSILELVLCGIQLVNAIIGVCCGDCRKREAPPPPPSPS